MEHLGSITAWLPDGVPAALSVRARQGVVLLGDTPPAVPAETGQLDRSLEWARARHWAASCCLCRVCLGAVVASGREQSWHTCWALRRSNSYINTSDASQVANGLR